MPPLMPKTLFIAAAAAVLAARQASATLTIDMRASLVDGFPNPNPKAIYPCPGSIITFDVYAIVTGATEAPGLEGFQIAVGSILSNTSLDAHMDVLTNALVSPFAAAGATVGRLADLDADGDIDIGSNATAAATADNISARSAAMTTGNSDGLGASEFKFYTFTARLGPMGQRPYAINWRKTDFTGLTTEYIWLENGVLTNSRGVNGGSVAQVQVGLPVANMLFCPPTPEPTVSLMVLAGALGLAGFRRIGR